MKIVILGNGISGITAARWIRKLSDHEIIVISSESEHFYSRTALMYIYMGHMRFNDTKPYEDHFWTKNRISLRRDHIASIDTTNKLLINTEGREISFDKLILAVGSKTNKFGWPGQDLAGVSGLYHLQDLETIEKYTADIQHAAIVGGGLIGIELAEMLRSRNIQVTLVVREENYWNNVLPVEEAQMISRHIAEHHIELRLKANLKEILSDEQGRARAIVIAETGEEIACQFVGLTAGVSPNIEWLHDSDIAINRGILVDEQLQTNIPDIYAIGDCAEVREPIPGHRSIEAVWYTGRMMGETVAYNICGHKVSYTPKLWFNSAKFLDIEYQVYGYVPNKPDESTGHLVWQHPAEHKLMRFVYDLKEGFIKGINLLGIRMRHEVCEKWILAKTPLRDVIKNLELAHFDPEFYRRYETDVLALYNKEFNETLSSSSRRGFNSVLSFLKN